MRIFLDLTANTINLRAGCAAQGSCDAALVPRVLSEECFKATIRDGQQFHPPPSSRPVHYPTTTRVELCIERQRNPATVG